MADVAGLVNRPADGVGCLVVETGIAAEGGKHGAMRRAANVQRAKIYRLKSASDAAWPAQVAYGRRESAWQRFAEAINVVGRLIVPVLLLLSALAASYIDMDARFSFLADASGRWFTAAHALLPLSFFAIALANRRYGPSYAFAQVSISLLILGTLATGAPDALTAMLPQSAPAARFGMSFAAAFFLASFVSVLLFDAARGRRWWSAPAFGLLASALVFPAIFFPLAYAGMDPFWTAHMLEDAAFMAAGSILLLVPYWILRPLVPPLSGYGGY